MIIWDNVFERIVVDWFRIRRQHLFMSQETGKLTWRDVPWGSRR